MREDFSKSAQYYQQSLRLSPKNPKVLSDLGYSYYMQKRLSESEAVLRQAIDAAPADALAHNNLGLVLGAAGRYEEAFEQFAAVSNTKAEARVNLAYTMVRNQRFDDAKQQLALALRENPELPAAKALFASLGPDASEDVGSKEVGLASAAPERDETTGRVRAALHTASTSTKTGNVGDSRASPLAKERPNKLPSVEPAATTAPTELESNTAIVTPASATTPLDSNNQATSVRPASYLAIVHEESRLDHGRSPGTFNESAATAVVEQEYGARSNNVGTAATSEDLYHKLRDATANAADQQYDPFE
jgi:tetratricopeptide (TPR) repeat protein